jgi:halocin C8-like bacteriocin domain-containing protein
MAKRINSIKVVHFDETTENGVRTQQVSVLIEIEGEKPRLIQGTQVLKGDVNGNHTINYTIFDGKNIGKATYSINTMEKNKNDSKLKIVGISEGKACCGNSKPIDTTLMVSNKTYSSNDPSIQCDICQAIIKEICEELAEGIPSEDICAEVCSEVCLLFVETLLGYLICVAICATVCELGLEAAENYGCDVGAQFICQKIGYC